MTQPRAVHEASPFTSLQLTPHAPQASMVERSVSQRSASSPLQSAKPEAQSTDVQVPPLQNAEAQVTLHFPQFSGSSRTLVSQMVVVSPSHSAEPTSQRGEPHKPFKHSLAPTQADAQPPQCPASVSGFLHSPAQQSQPVGHVWSAMQPRMHMAFSQRVPAEQSTSL
jgi:hypothetical protein